MKKDDNQQRITVLANHRAQLLTALREIEYNIRFGDSTAALQEIQKVRAKVQLQ